MEIKKILIVDDSPTERHILSRILVRKGYQVVIAENGARAIAVAKETGPDLVLMDIVMPDVNGFQAIRMFLRDQTLRTIPVIICSTKGQEIDKIWGMRQGAKDYIVKPILAEELLQKIARFNTPE
jgi:twitching motility two-component system response regulator PilH